MLAVTIAMLKEKTTAAGRSPMIPLSAGRWSLVALVAGPSLGCAKHAAIIPHQATAPPPRQFVVGNGYQSRWLPLT